VTAVSPLEALAVLASLLSVWLTIQRRISCWPVGLVAVTAYCALFVRERLYADAAMRASYRSTISRPSREARCVGRTRRHRAPIEF
jgi:hypothetical protein